MTTERLIEEYFERPADAATFSLYGPTKKALLDSVELQPHQQRVVKKVRKQLDETGKSRLLLVHGLGSGKTLSSIAGSEQAGVPYTAAVPASLRENYRKDLEKFSPDSPAAVISHEALAKGQVPNPESLVIDECMPAGTLIDGKPIEQYRPGDSVRSLNHETGEIENKSVLWVASRETDEILLVQLRDGGRIVCTANHPIFTGRGYVFAKDLTEQDEIFRFNLPTGRIECVNANKHRELSDLREGVHYASLPVSRTTEALLDHLPKGGLGCRHEEGQRRVSAADQTAYEDRQPYVRSSLSEEGVRCTQGERTQTTGAGRQWARADRTRDDDGGCPGLGADNYSDRALSGREWLSYALQGRRWLSSFKDSGGDRWPVAQYDFSPRTGREENGIPNVVGVACVSVYQSSGNGEFERLCPDGVVFDIEVQDNHNFFVDGYLVHNSQRLRNPESQRGGALLDRAQNLKSLLLLSGTPIVNDPKDLATYISALTDKQITPQEFSDRYVRRTTYRPGLLRRILGARTLQPGVQNEDELVDLLKGKVDFHESTKSPARVDRQDVFVNMSPTQSEIYRGMYKKLPALTRWKLESQYDLSPNELQRMRSFMTGPRQVGLSEYGVVGADRLSPLKAFDRSPKLQEAFKRLQSTLKTNPDAKSLIFSNFIGSGLTPYLAGLQRANIPAAVFSGAMNDQQRKQVVEDYNAGKIKALLLGPSGTEGLSTKGTRLVQRLDPHWNEARSRQSDGRALRYDSHLHLSPEDRQVMIERYFSRPMSRGVLGLYGQRPMQGADDYLTALADKKEKLNSQFMQTLQRAAEAE